jgi:hypothetical protein
MAAHTLAVLVVDGIGGTVVVAVGDPPPTDMHMVLVPYQMQLVSAAHDVGSKWSEHAVGVLGAPVGVPVGAVGVAVGAIVVVLVTASSGHVTAIV